MKHNIRVYHEDTDFLGIVYYANYFKYIERGRSESIRDLENFHNLKNCFAVASLYADFKSPAKFNDLLNTSIQSSRTSKRDSSILPSNRSSFDLFKIRSLKSLLFLKYMSNIIR